MTESEYWQKRHDMEAEFHALRMAHQRSLTERSNDEANERQEAFRESMQMNNKILKHRIKEEGVE